MKVKSAQETQCLYADLLLAPRTTGANRLNCMWMDLIRVETRHNQCQMINPRRRSKDHLDCARHSATMFAHSLLETKMSQ